MQRSLWGRGGDGGGGRTRVQDGGIRRFRHRTLFLPSSANSFNSANACLLVTICTALLFNSVAAVVVKAQDDKAQADFYRPLIWKDKPEMRLPHRDAKIGALEKLLEAQRNLKPATSKRTDGMVEFMGMRVSYPQYLRLRAIQREVMRMDRMIRRMVRHYDPAELAETTGWLELLAFYDSFKKLLPHEYRQQGPIPVRRRNGGDGGGGMAYYGFDDPFMSH